MTDLADISALELAADIRNRKVSPVEVVDAVLKRIEARSDLNAFITVAADQARSAAREAEAVVMRREDLPVLHGVPFSVKDLLNTAGIATTMGAIPLRDNVPANDAVAVARVKAVGGIVIGKTTTPEFGHVQSPTSPLFGRTLNPIDPTVTPGASSSGSAVAVASGMGPLSLGTDGGGSVRIPAACCGIVGLKPTLGVVPHLQLPDLFGANSYIGPMARSVADTRLLFDAVAGPDHNDPFGQALHPLRWQPVLPLAGLRVGWIPRGGARVETETARVTEHAVRALEAEGARVELIEVDFKSFEPVFLTILQVGLAARAAPLIAGHENQVAPSLIAAISLGRRASAVELAEAQAARTGMFRTFQNLFERFDVLVSPTLTAPPLPNDMDPTGDIEVEGRAAGTIRGAWYPFTFPQNLTGHPAISVPCGWTRSGLPVGLQFCGPWYSERLLLDLAERCEELCSHSLTKADPTSRLGRPSARP